MAEDDGCVHDWQPVEVLLEVDAADTLSVCRLCGQTGYEAGRGRTRRPELPDIVFTRAETPRLDATAYDAGQSDDGD